MKPSLLSRRQFVTAASLAALGAAASCSNSGSKEPSVTSSARLHILNWPLYIDEGTVPGFESETLYTVDYEEGYEGNESAFTGLFATTLADGEPTGYDVIVPTYWAVARMLDLGWLEPLPLERIPNHTNVGAAFLGMPWDRGARFHMPWQVGITGIAYNPALTNGADIGSISDLLDPSLNGQVGMVVEMREVLGLLMLSDGQDPSQATVAAAETALDELEQIVRTGQIAAFTASEFVDELKEGNFAACLAWSGDIIQLQAERPDIRFVIPEEGAIRWFDSMIIPAGAANARGAADWMNYVYDPENAAAITEFVQYISPVEGVRDALVRKGGDSAALADNPILFPDEETASRLYFWSGLDAEDEDALQARFDEIIDLL